MNVRLKLIVALVAAAGVLLVLKAVLFGPSDRQLIDDAVKESVQASREGRPGGVVEYLSRSFTLNGDSGFSQRDIARFIKSGKPEVVIRTPEPVISGDTAEIVSPVHVKFDYLAYKFDQDIPQVHIKLQKEAGTQFLVIPTKKWRIVSVTAPEVSVGEFSSN
jgi:hypothetical protein